MVYVHSVLNSSPIDIQGCSGAGKRQSAVPAIIFEPEWRSGKYYHSRNADTAAFRQISSYHKKVTLYTKFDHL